MPFPLRALAVVLAAAIGPTVARANDGFGGLGGSGLQFDRSAAVRLVSEDLSLSLGQIEVEDVLHNPGASALRGTLRVALPPLALATLAAADFALTREELNRTNIVDFTARVDGRPVAVTVDRVALLVPDEADPRPSSTALDPPGEEVTALLARYDIPLSLDYDTVVAALDGLPQDARDTLEAAHAAAFAGGARPLWAISERYSWSQTLPAGGALRITTRYRAVPSGGIFLWRGPQEQAALVARYCIDKKTAKAIRAALPRDTESDGTSLGTAYYLDYAPPDTTRWAGPIGRFKLTIDKDQAVNVLALCLDGLKKSGATAVALDKRNFTPPRDLRLLIIAPNEEE